MQQKFSAALALVLQSEGGFVNNRFDPGGATNYGITERVYDAFRRLKGLPLASVRYIGMGDVQAIYQAQYWGAVRGDDLPAGIDYLTFDEAVNSGPVRAIKDLQAALGVKADGHLGAITMAALLAVKDRAGLINRVCDIRLGFMRRLKTWQVFGKGWSNRVAAVRASALQMAA
jgi:lysozyme family protein